MMMLIFVVDSVKDMSLMRGGREAGEQTTHASQDSLTDLTQQPYMMSNSDQTQVSTSRQGHHVLLTNERSIYIITPQQVMKTHDFLLTIPCDLHRGKSYLIRCNQIKSYLISYNR